MADNDGTEIAHLAALSVLDYEREREGAAERLGCRVMVLDDLVADARDKAGAADNGKSSRSLALAEIEPWPEAADGAAMLDTLAAEIRRYVVVGAAEADSVALWVLATHAFDAFWVFPRLFVTAPEKGCGKSTLLDVVSRLVPRPLVASNITAAALFRTIEAAQPVLLLDEAESYTRDNEDLRGVLNAGHRRDGGVVRCVGDNHEPRLFSAWAPVALAAIGRLPGTIEDRSIKIKLRRRKPDEFVEALRLDCTDALAKLARMAARYAVDHATALQKADPVMPDGIVNREADNWRPLLAIADAVGGEWPERARRAAVGLMQANADEIEAPGIILLADLRERFAAESSGVLFTTEILPTLYSREDRPWAEFRRGRPITAIQMAELLKPYGIPRNNTVRRGAKTAKGYRAKDFIDIWDRYLPPYEAVTRSQASDSGASRDLGPVTSDRVAVTGEPAAVTPSGDVTETGPGVTGPVTEKG
jgi:Protein of unknown function (DUF3631)